jgi:hypothetical protein
LNVGNEEAVASLGNGFDILGMLSVISDRLPQLANGHPEAAVEINEGVFGPNAIAKVRPGDHLPGVLKKHD